MASTHYDVIVMGLGGVGSAAAFALAKRGANVLGLDQFSPPHTRGSSHGETRIIRKAYFEHPAYVPLLQHAYELWHELEVEYGERLFHRTGLIEIGPEDGIVIPGVHASAKQFGLAIEEMSMQEAIKRYPVISGDESWSVILEKDAGYLRVEACIEAQLRLASKLGANLQVNQNVIEWRSEGRGVVVRTSDAIYSADRMILAAGPWAPSESNRISVPFKILRKHLYWYPSNSRHFQESHGFPCFFFETKSGYYYGFPQRDELGVKVARHSGGEVITTEIDGVHAEDPADQQLVESFLGSYLPGIDRSLNHSSGCYYTMTPDENFVIDRLPECPQVTVVAGLSGHGFKFTSVLGEIAAGMSLGEATDFDLDFLSLKRFAK